MTRYFGIACVAAVILQLATIDARQAGLRAKAMVPGGGHVILAPGDMKWGPAPAGLPAGAQVAVLAGDPAKSGQFTIRLKMPNGYKVASHTHPADEHIVVIEGTFRIGMGDAYSEGAFRDLPTGGYLLMPRGMRHFAGTKGPTIVQISGQGPFQINYVDPEQDPRRK